MCCDVHVMPGGRPRTLFCGFGWNAKIYIVPMLGHYMRPRYQTPNTTLDHIGIDVNSLISVNTSALPSFNLTGNITASIQYDNISSIMVVTLWLGDGRDRNYSHASKVDLKNALPVEVDVGFSASTVGAIELHQLLSWYFNSSLERKTAQVAAPPNRYPPRGDLHDFSLVGRSSSEQEEAGGRGEGYRLGRRGGHGDEVGDGAKEVPV